MIILGVDPGLTKTGWGLISCINNNLSFIASGTIYTVVKEPIHKRIACLHRGLFDVVKQYQPHQAAIEETFINTNPASSLKLGHARGAIMLTLSLNEELEIFEYSTTAVKKAVVGVGRADKHQVATMIKYLLPKSTAKTEDESDALAIAICHNNNSASMNRYSINKYA
jgi:crossover junction endodeoxyribonuclease RuvC